MQSSDSNYPNAIAALLIEDSESDADLLRERLNSLGGVKVTIDWADCLKNGLALLKVKHFDVLVLDLSLPDSFSIETLKKARAAVPELPIIIMTGLADQELGLLAVKEGAQDYLVKGQVGTESIHRVMRYAIERKKVESLLQKTAAQALESEAKLLLAMKASQVVPWIWHLDQDCPEFDDRDGTVFGGNVPKSLVAFLDVVHEVDAPAVRDSLCSTRSDSRGELKLEFRVLWPDTSVHWIRMLGQRISDHEVAPGKVAGVCKDISVAKEQELTARRMELLKQKEEFMALLAHDLRNPLVGTSRILSHMLSNSKAITADERSWLADIFTSQQSLLQLINNVVDSYRLDSKQQALYCTETDVVTLIESIVAECRPLAEWNNLRLTFSVTSTHTVAADSQAMHRVFGNLISNSIKFTPSGGTIEISAVDQNDSVLIQVKDSGIGIESSLVDKIFEPFFQTRLEDRAKGSGLGLHLCKNLIESQNGSITCRSTPGVGTVFEIKLPRFSVEADSQALPVLILSHAMEETHRTLIQAFQNSDLQIDVVPDRATALLYAKTGNYAAIFLEIGHATADDFVTAGAIKRLAANTPIFGYGNVAHCATALAEAGFHSYVGEALGRQQIEESCALALNRERKAS